MIRINLLLLADSTVKQATWLDGTPTLIWLTFFTFSNNIMVTRNPPSAETPVSSGDAFVGTHARPEVLPGTPVSMEIYPDSFIRDGPCLGPKKPPFSMKLWTNMCTHNHIMGQHRGWNLKLFRFTNPYKVNGCSLIFYSFRFLMHPFQSWILWY